MARIDEKHMFGIAVKHEDGTVYEFSFMTTEVIRVRWIEPEMGRRLGTISSWFDDILGDFTSPSEEQIYKMLEEDSWTRFMNNAQHIKDILNELEIDFNMSVKHEEPLTKEELENGISDEESCDGQD